MSNVVKGMSICENNHLLFYFDVGHSKNVCPEGGRGYPKSVRKFRRVEEGSSKNVHALMQLSSCNYLQSFLNK